MNFYCIYLSEKSQGKNHDINSNYKNYLYYLKGPNNFHSNNKVIIYNYSIF